MSWDPVLIWFVVGLVFVLSEFLMPGVILVFFGAGAWITALAIKLGLAPDWTPQLLIFSVSSVLLLVVLRRWFRTRFFGRVGEKLSPEDDLDDLAGQNVLVLDTISPGSVGKVEYRGAVWQARSETEISAGTEAVIVSTEGIALIVRPRG
ncbi:MAG: hypothetical protein ACI9UK_000604 [Candidatus Krumholzibacteriia bacterium]|jgi:membrane protein implicated in regulation of membrane protease activity